MQQLIDFAANNLLLVIALLVVLTLLAISFIQSGKLSVDPQQATRLINREDAVVLDIRPMADFNKGHIVNAINIPLNGFKNQIQTLQKHKQKPIIVNCRSGNQSQIACRDLRKAGFDKVFNLRGGMISWEASHLPISKH
jgi:rhodanese-related sulfurtransferase